MDHFHGRRFNAFQPSTLTTSEPQTLPRAPLIVPVYSKRVPKIITVSSSLPVAIRESSGWTEIEKMDSHFVHWFCGVFDAGLGEVKKKLSTLCQVTLGLCDTAGTD